MRICILANALSIHTQRHAIAYAGHGHDVHVLSIRRADIPGVRVHQVCAGPANSPSVVWTFLSYARLFAAAKRQLRRLRPDVLQACYATTHGVIAWSSGYHPVVLSVWGSDIVSAAPRQPWRLRLAIRRALASADVVCATSAFLVEQTRRYAPPDKPIHQTPIGVDTKQFCPNPSTTCGNASDLPAPDRLRKGFRIGFVKTLRPHYGPDALIRAMASVIRQVPEARLIMVGHDGMGGTLQELVADLRLGDHVEFVGFVAHERLPEIMRTFDVFAHPSVCQEAFGVSVLEASACGVPVVATRVGGVPEVCDDKRTGVLVPPGDPGALAAALIDLAGKPKLRSQMGRNGRQFVLDRYAWENTVEIMLGYLQRAADDGAGSGEPR